MVRTAVICVLHNSSAWVPQLASALRVQLEDPAWLVVLVDSGSTDDTIARSAAELPGSEVVELGRNRGYAAGINEGVEHARRRGADRFIVMNPDVRPHPGCLETLVSELAGRPRPGLTVPRLVDEHGRLLFSLRRSPTVLATLAEGLLGGGRASRWRLRTEVFRDDRLYQVAHDAADWATGGLIAFDERAWAGAGRWDESFFLYEEEVEWCLRARDAGLRLRFCPTASATRHIGDGPVAGWAEALMRTNRVRHMRRRSGRPSALAHRGALLLALTVRSIRGRDEARVALSAVARMSTPEEIMRRYSR